MNRLVCLLLLLGLSGGGTMPRAAEAAPAASLSEVLSILKTNLTDVSDRELDRAAVAGLLDHFAGRVTLVSNETAPAKPSLIAKTALYNQGAGYIRLGNVGPGLAKALREAYDKLAGTNKLKGLVLDVRFADGPDDDEAIAAADLFFKQPRVLLKRGARLIRATGRSDAIGLPLVLLVNEKTAGAAEVLAAILHENKAGLAIGTAPARPARYYREFTLSNGQKLRVATAAVTVGAPGEFSLQAIEPDIATPTKLAEEKLYLEDPYRTNGPNQTAAAGTSSNLFSSLPRHHWNEADLVRLQRAGLSLQDETVAPVKAEVKPVITDPALGRALDFLKGLSVVLNR